jgi:putative two-component system response regulator
MSHKPKILAVDDNPVNLEVLVEALGDEFIVATAEDGSKALELAPTFRPDVVLLDVMMPGRDGFDVCRTLKQDYNLRSSRIIMVSAKAELSARLQGYDCGADDYVTKPFREEELMTKIVFALRTKRLESLCGATGEALALLSELRDTGTDPIMPAIRYLSNLIASELSHGAFHHRIDRQFLDDMHHASVLRDVGMLAVPESIREKTADLTTEEVEQEKEHTLVGAALLSRLSGEHRDVSYFQMAAEIARSHHERYDGGGFPDRLRAEQIPLAARIVCVAEGLLKAIESALSTDDDAGRAACAAVAAGSGSLYDPQVAATVKGIATKLSGFSDLEGAAQHAMEVFAS